MPRYELRVGGHIDVLDKNEMREIVDEQTKQLIAEAEGIKHIDFYATGTIAAGAVTIPSPNPASVGQLQIPDLGPEDGYIWSLQRVTIDGLPKFTGTQTVNTPAVPASTTPVQNPYPFPVTVVISGGTVTAVVVNGLTVGTGDGTYIVPSAGSISITYSVAPTWAWSQTTGTQNGIANPDFLIVYKNFVAGGNRLFSINATEEWEFPGSHAGTLKGGDVLIAVGSGLNATGTLTLSGEAIEVPAVKFAKLVGRG